MKDIKSLIDSKKIREVIDFLAIKGPIVIIYSGEGIGSKLFRDSKQALETLLIDVGWLNHSPREDLIEVLGKKEDWQFDEDGRTFRFYLEIGEAAFVEILTGVEDVRFLDKNSEEKIPTLERIRVIEETIQGLAVELRGLETLVGLDTIEWIGDIPRSNNHDWRCRTCRQVWSAPVKRECPTCLGKEPEKQTEASFVLYHDLVGRIKAEVGGIEGVVFREGVHGEFIVDGLSVEQMMEIMQRIKEDFPSKGENLNA